MTTKVSGLVSIVTAEPSTVHEVWLTVARPRTHDGGLIVEERRRIPVEDGQLNFEAIPGPAVLSVPGTGAVPLVVPEGAGVSLGACVEAARLADGGERSALERLAGEAAGAVESAAASAGEARSSADKARTSAANAWSAASVAQQSVVEADNSAGLARGYSSEARDSAGKAASSASQAAASASDAKASATAASTSASQARASADRAGRIASSTSWSGDRLTVNGKQSPPLTGPRGPMGRVEGHTHPISEVNGLQDWLDWHKDILDEYAETLRLLAPREDVSALRKDLVSVRAELEAVRSRPALWSGSGKPPASIPGARVGDWWLDESSMDLYRIAGV